MMLKDAESQHSSCSLKFWWHQLTYMTAEAVAEMSGGARGVGPGSLHFGQGNMQLSLLSSSSAASQHF